MKEIKIEELLNINNNLKIIDIRDNYLFNIGNIPNAINIPMNLLIMNPSNYLNKNEIYYIYCNRGISSKKTCELLTSLGYNVINIIGGYMSYQQLIDKQ